MDDNLVCEYDMNIDPNELDKALIEAQDSQDPENVAEIVEVD